MPKPLVPGAHPRSEPGRPQPASPLPARQSPPVAKGSVLRPFFSLATLGAAAACALALPAPAARAVELLQFRLPLLGNNLSARVSELRSAEALWNGTSDLAELNRATDGLLADHIAVFLNHPLPRGDFHGSPMVQQIRVMLKQLIEVDDAENHAIKDGDPVQTALRQLRASGRPANLFNLLEELPGQTVTIRLDRAVPFIRRIQHHSRLVAKLIKEYPTLPAAPAEALRPGPFAVRTTVVTLPGTASHDPLEVTLVLPVGTPTLAPVVISHGLWDAPTSFLGWAQHLASHGAPVFLPRHPGSDISQQAAMLAGKVPPPKPQEFLRRPNEVKTVLDALDAGTVPGASGIKAQGVTFIGHSWGGTTALQLAGARSLPTPLWKDCANAYTPRRNLSWILQCSFLPAATDASMADPRIVRVMAVSPPQGLVFAAGLMDLKVPVLLVGGTDDFVVPVRPEAVTPFGDYPQRGNQLVLADGGTHFNLPAHTESNGGPLRALLLSWVRGQPLKNQSRVWDPKDLPLHLIPLSRPQP